jgi:hypothetical protein
MSAETLAAIAVALGAGWASGLNAYAAVLVLGAAERLGLVDLPHDLQVLASPWVLGVAALLFALNFFADKIPYVDSINDMLQTFVRIPAGFLLAYGAAGGLSPEVAAVAGLLGGTLAAGTHIAKTGSRALINTSPEPFSNIGASLVEDSAVPAGLWLAVAHPLVFGVVLVALLGLSLWLIHKSWRFLRALFGRMARIFSGRPDPGVESAFTSRRKTPNGD